MNAKGRFISTLLVINSFFASFAIGFNSRHVLVIDPSLPAVNIDKKQPDRSQEAKKATTGEEPNGSKGSTGGSKNGADDKLPKSKDASKNGSSATKSHGKTSHKHKTKKE